MEIWQVVVLVVAVAVAAAIGAAVAYGRGREAGESESRPRPAEGDHSLFGEDLPVLPTERRFVEVMPYALIVADSAGAVAYASKGADPLNLVRNGRLVAEDIGEVLALVVADGQVRERELKVTLPRPDRRQDGRGVRAGEAVPTDTLYLRVRIGAIADDLFAIFLHDMSEQRRFEAMRRDFITNVSHELKTPSGAISLLAETITDAADDPDAVRYFAGRITKESQRLAELVHKLIELQRAQDAPAMSDAKPMSVVAMTRESIAANEVQADAKQIGIVLSLNGRVIPVEVPEGEPETLDDDVLVRVGREPFTTAVKNLVENAIHYSPAHTTVSVGHRRGRRFVCVSAWSIRASASPRSRWAVSSNGSTAWIRRAPVKRAVRASDWRSPSTACRSAAVRSPSGRARAKGSTFTIELPVA